MVCWEVDFAYFPLCSPRIYWRDYLLSVRRQKCTSNGRKAFIMLRRLIAPRTVSVVRLQRQFSSEEWYKGNRYSEEGALYFEALTRPGNFTDRMTLN